MAATAQRITVDTSALRDVLDRGMTLDLATQNRLADVLAEHAIDWKLALKGPAISAPGEGTWPVGRIRHLGARNERYVDSDDPEGRDSGRSLGAWTVDQRGLTVTARNTARSARRVFYAEFVHFSGDPVGEAADRAWEDFQEAFASRAAEQMADVIAAALGGR